MILQLSIAYGLTCEFTTTCSNTDVYHLYRLANSHAELPAFNYYNYSLCCEHSGDILTTSCDANSATLFTLSNSTNAHAELNTENNYFYDVCLSGTDGSIVCEYKNDCTGFDACLGSLSTIEAGGDSNLHLADCTTDPYSTKVCCNYKVHTGYACTSNTDCLSGYCRTDYSVSLDYCAADSNDCVYNGTSYENGVIIDFRWICNDGVWDEDVTPPTPLTISNVEQKTTQEGGYYWDTNDNAQTTVTLISTEEVDCRIGINDQTYSLMAGYHECTFNAIDDIECIVPSLVEERYTYYISCRDLAGNDQLITGNTEVDFGIDFTNPTTIIDNTSGVHLPGHLVAVNEQDNIATTVEITTYECHPTLDCTPTTIVDHGDTIEFSTRGTNYIKWYSIDLAGNNQSIMEETITINSLPTVEDIGYFLNGFDGTTGSQVIFYCDIADANGNIGSNYGANIWIKKQGSVTWDKLDNISMVYDSGIRFKTQMSIGGDVYGDSYDVRCSATDDLGETGPSLTVSNVFSVQNSAPIVDDISIQAEVHKYETMRIYCDGSDPDGLAEGDLTATLYMKTDNSGYPPWDRINGVIMNYDGLNHYYDYQVIDDSGTEFDIRCVLSDGILEGSLDEFKFEDAGSFVGIADDWDKLIADMQEIMMVFLM